MSRKINLTNLLTLACKKNSKIPATKHGYLDAKKQDVKLLHSQGFNIGLAMRQNHLICLDVDEKNGKTGIQDLQKLEEQLGKLPKTLKQKSCTGQGFHLIFNDENVRNPRGNIGENNSIDIRWNGYILCEPSIVNGSSYKFIDSIDDYGNIINIAKLPKKWIDFINSDNSTKTIHKRNLGKTRTVKYKYNPIKNYDLEQIFNRCKFLQYCKINAVNLKEYMWFSMISILAQLDGCESLIHELSAPYPKYSFKETEYKISRAKNFGKPQSCNYISKQYPEICKGCKEHERR